MMNHSSPTSHFAGDIPPNPHKTTTRIPIVRIIRSRINTKYMELILSLHLLHLLTVPPSSFSLFHAFILGVARPLFWVNATVPFFRCGHCCGGLDHLVIGALHPTRMLDFETSRIRDEAGAQILAYMFAQCKHKKLQLKLDTKIL